MIHVVFWLPGRFYSAVAATLVEMLEIASLVRGTPGFSFEFVSRKPNPESTSGMSFPSRVKPSKPADVLVLLGTPGLQVAELVRSLAAESAHAAPHIVAARRRKALIAAHCSASYYLADAGLLDGKLATISWWLKPHVHRLFPRVRWDADRLLIRGDNLYTCGGGFAGLELGSALLRDLGFAAEERIVRKLLVLPPPRASQTPYEYPLEGLTSGPDAFPERLNSLVKSNLEALSPAFLARHLGMSPRTLARRFSETLRVSPGQWIRERRMEAARHFLETTRLSVAEVCSRVGYQDVASFSRLFSLKTGLAPSEYRRQSA
jgi:transcriptional regulator GlxA family with amidase domain